MAGDRSFFENEWIFPASHGPGKSGRRTLAAELSLYWEERVHGCTALFPSRRKHSCLDSSQLHSDQAGVLALTG